MIASFSVLLYFGGQIYHKAPPIPESVATSTGEVIYTRADIERGQNYLAISWWYAAGLNMGARELSCT